MDAAATNLGSHRNDSNKGDGENERQPSEEETGEAVEGTKVKEG
jgi:hypothetical protein